MRKLKPGLLTDTTHGAYLPTYAEVILWRTLQLIINYINYCYGLNVCYGIHRLKF